MSTTTEHHHHHETTTIPLLKERGLSLTTILPISTTFLLVLIVILFLRYHLYSSSYKTWMKRLRRRSRSDDEETNVPIDEEMFKPPPEYETAVNMPKPCSCRNQCKETCDICDSTLCNNSDSKSDIESGTSSESNTCKCRCHSESNAISETACEQSRESPNDSHQPDSCNVKLYLESETNNTSEILKGPFVILEHVQRMAQDPNKFCHCLPSYQEYIKEFPN